jgi:hypothetical protein
MSGAKEGYSSKNGSASGRPKAIIVGAGIGGCASAARLTQGGFDVTGEFIEVSLPSTCELINRSLRSPTFDQSSRRTTSLVDVAVLSKELPIIDSIKDLVCTYYRNSSPSRSRIWELRSITKGSNSSNVNRITASSSPTRNL